MRQVRTVELEGFKLWKNAQKVASQQDEVAEKARFNEDGQLMVPIDVLQHRPVREYVIRGAGRFGDVFAGKSTFLNLPLRHPLRIKVIRIVNNAWFRRAVLLTILINTVIIAFDNPLHDTISGFREIEITCTVLFTVEMLLKIIALGFFKNKHSYLRDGWNILDASVVLISYVNMIADSSGSDNLAALRIARVLRPLRSISGYAGMRILVRSLFTAIPMMTDVAVLIAFVLFLFGITGMQLFGGKLRQRCFLEADGSVFTNRSELCRTGPSGSATFHCATSQFCADAGADQGPEGGAIGFDNIFQAWLSILTIASLEGWTDTTYYVWESWSYLGTAYFVLLVTFVAFFVLQLVSALVFSAYLTCDAEEEDYAQRMKIRKMRKDAMKAQLRRRKEEAGMVSAGQVTLMGATVNAAVNERGVVSNPDQLEFEPEDGGFDDSRFDESQFNDDDDDDGSGADGSGDEELDPQLFQLTDALEYKSVSAQLGRKFSRSVNRTRRSSSAAKRRQSTINRANAERFDLYEHKATGKLAIKIQPPTAVLRAESLRALEAEQGERKQTAQEADVQDYLNHVRRRGSVINSKRRSMMSRQGLVHGPYDEDLDFARLPPTDDEEDEKKDWKADVRIAEDSKRPATGTGGESIPLAALPVNDLSDSAAAGAVSIELQPFAEAAADDAGRPAAGLGLDDDLDDAKSSPLSPVSQTALIGSGASSSSPPAVVRSGLSPPAPGDPSLINLHVKRGSAMGALLLDESTVLPAIRLNEEDDSDDGHHGEAPAPPPPGLPDASEPGGDEPRAGRERINTMEAQDLAADLFRGAEGPGEKKEKEGKSDDDDDLMVGGLRIDTSRFRPSVREVAAEEEKKKDRRRSSLKKREEEEAERKRLQDEKDREDLAASRCPTLLSTCRRLARNRYFEPFIIVIIILNTAVLASEHYEQSQSLTDFIENSNYAFSVIFCLEAVVKIIALGFRQYVKDSFNVFDLVVVLTSMLDILISAFTSGLNAGVTSFRAFRLLRVFKLARAWRGFQSLLSTVVRSLNSIANFTLLSGLFVFVCGLVGVQLFAGKMQDPVTKMRPRAHFDYLGWGCVVVFQILGGENWNEVMYGGIAGAGWGSAVYFVLVFVIGHYLFLNLFLAILLSNFDYEQQQRAMEKAMEQERVMQEQAEAMKNARLIDSFFEVPDDENLSVSGASLSLASTIGGGASGVSPGSVASRNGGAAGSPAAAAGGGDGAAGSPSSAEREKASLSIRQGANDWIGGVDEDAPITRTLTDDEWRLMSGDIDAGRNRNGVRKGKGKDGGMGKGGTMGGQQDDHAKGHAVLVGRGAFNLKDGVPVSLHGNSLWLFSAKSTFRTRVFQLVSHPNFEGFILTCIIVSSLLQMLDEPHLDKSSKLAQTLRVFDFFFTTIFTLEMCLKSIAFGFVLHKQAYLRDNWNQLDCVIVVISIVDLSVTNVRFIRSFRSLRCLRPLRMVRRYESMMVILKSIARALPSVVNVLLVAFLFYLVFGILGVNIYKGRFFQCEEHGVGSVDPDPAVLALDRDDCIAGGYAWKNPDYGHFDDIGSALLILFEVSTMEMWPTIMLRAVDIGGEHRAPVLDNHPVASLYFVVFLIVGSFFVTNIFVGVVVDTFTQMMADVTYGTNLLTKKQHMWLELQKLMLYARAKVDMRQPKQRWRAHVYRFVSHPYFEMVVAFLIVANIFFMSLWYYDQPRDYELVLEGISNFFTFAFLLEAILKITAFGTQYFSSRWNLFDFALVCVSLLEFLLEYAAHVAGSQQVDLTLLRVFRILRVFRLVKRAKGLKNLINTLWLSLPAFGNIGALLLFLFFVYAIAGMSLFGKLPFRQHLTRHANFENFPRAYFTLFRMSTGESWNGLMHDCVRKECPAGWTGFTNADGTCGSFMAVPYFISFVIICQFMMLNLFIAVVLEEFETVDQRLAKEGHRPLALEDLNEYVFWWKELELRSPHYTPRKCWEVWKRKNEWLEWDLFQILMVNLRAGLNLSKHSTGRNDVLANLPIPIHVRTVVQESPLPDTPPTFKRVPFVHFMEGLLALSQAAFRFRSFDPEEDDMATLHIGDVLPMRVIKAKMKAKFKGVNLASHFGDQEVVGQGDTVYRTMAGEIAQWKRQQRLRKNRRLRGDAAAAADSEQARKARDSAFMLSLLSVPADESGENQYEDGGGSRSLATMRIGPARVHTKTA